LVNSKLGLLVETLEMSIDADTAPPSCPSDRLICPRLATPKSTLAVPDVDEFKGLMERLTLPLSGIAIVGKFRFWTTVIDIDWARLGHKFASARARKATKRNILILLTSDGRESI
jgi:hypothetical protein